jgi:hypothetical protein
MSKLIYLAYGSNLHPLRLQARLPSARLIGTTALDGYALKFHKLGQCLSGKCNLVRTHDEGDTAYGAVFEIAASEKTLLDEFEGPGYRTEGFKVNVDGSTYESFAYIAELAHIDEALRPFDWYKSLVHYGSQYHRFPDAYLRKIECVESVADPEAERHHWHMQLINKMKETL